MAISALFDPEILQTEFTTQTLRPEKIGPSLIQGNYIIVVNHRADYLLFPPDPLP